MAKSRPLELSVVAGADLKQVVRLKSRLNATVTTYSGTETLELRAGRGDAQSAVSLAASSAVWVDADAGTIQLHFHQDDTDDLLGRYFVYLAITAGGVRAEVVVALLTVLPAPGADVALSVYCTADDLERVASWIEDLEPDEPTVQAGWTEARHQARLDIDRVLLARARATLESQLSAHSPVLDVDPIVPSSGVDAGPSWGPSVYPDTTLRDQLDVVRGLLDDDRLIQDGELVEAAANLAVWHACRSMIGGGDGETDYQALAKQCRMDGRRILRGWTGRVREAATETVVYWLE